MIQIHVIAGLIALFAGTVALSAAKGSILHRRSGIVFAAAMVVMTVSAVVVATFWSPNRVNIVAATLTFYLVTTGVLTMRNTVTQMRVPIAALMAVALATSGFAFTLGFEALGNPSGVVDKVPAPPVFMFAIVGLFAASLDARMLWVGGIRGAHRLARHLWRMTFALWIATASFFLGQAQVFPDPVRKTALLAIPVVVVAILLFYWLARVLVKRERAVMSELLR